MPTPPGKAPAVIPVGRIRGPVLLTCGEQDVVWPSCRYVDAITTRLRAHRFTHPSPRCATATPVTSSAA